MLESLKQLIVQLCERLISCKEIAKEYEQMKKELQEIERIVKQCLEETE